jgi:hypothetical protein
MGEGGTVFDRYFIWQASIMRPLALRGHKYVEVHENYVGTDAYWKIPILPSWKLQVVVEVEIIYEVMNFRPIFLLVVLRFTTKAIDWVQPFASYHSPAINLHQEHDDALFTRCPPGGLFVFRCSLGYQQFQRSLRLSGIFQEPNGWLW